METSNKPTFREIIKMLGEFLADEQKILVLQFDLN